jgi:vacuolar-type H+-ATPase subunit H
MTPVPLKPGEMSDATDLGQLLAAEARLERVLTEAKADAARLVADAESQAAERERRLDMELESEGADLQARLERERLSREAELQAAAEAAAARYDRLDAGRVAAVAGNVVARLLAAS